MDEEKPKGDRISKVMSHAGLCSRRDAERWIEEGRVTLNGKKLTTPAVLVGEDDIVEVDGNRITGPLETRLWLFHKPRGYLTTDHDPEGRPTYKELLPSSMPRVVSVGRLDMDSEGLLLLTTNGTLAGVLESPETGWARRYRVRVHGVPQNLTALRRGITADGMHYKSIEAEIEREGSNSWLNVTIREGKNREIRRVFEHLGHPVSRLIRTAYGPCQLGKLEPEEVREVTRKQLKNWVGNYLDK